MTSIHDGRDSAKLHDIARQYHEWGANVTCVQHKRPLHKWKHLLTERQTLDELNGYPWQNATGVGHIALTWRSLDIDAPKAEDGTPLYNVPFDPVVTTALESLGLPEDYKHVYRTGSGAGWQITIVCTDGDPSDVLAPKRGEKGVYWGEAKDGYKFDHIELRWNQHSVLPPSTHESGGTYAYHSGFPDGAPASVSIGHIVTAFITMSERPEVDDAGSRDQTPRRRRRRTEPAKGHEDHEDVEAIKASIRLEEFARRHWSGQVTTDQGEKRILGNGGLLIKEDEGVWYCFADEIGGDAVDLIGYHLHGARWDRYDKEQFKEALRWGADYTGHTLVHGNGSTKDSSRRTVETEEIKGDVENYTDIVSELDTLIDAGKEGGELLDWALDVAERLAWSEGAKIGRVKIEKKLAENGVTKRAAHKWAGVVWPMIQEAEQQQKAAASHRQTLDDLDGDKPIVKTNNEYLHEKADVAYDALIDANDPPHVFFYVGAPARIKDVGEAGFAIERVNVDSMRDLLSRSANFVKEVALKQGFYYKKVSVPQEIAQNILNRPAYRELPELRGITTVPVLGTDWAFQTDEGYSPTTKMVYKNTADLAIGDTYPTPANVDAAKNLILDDLLHDFPFEDEPSRVNAVALLILPFIRPIIDGVTPLHMIDAPVHGSGKGLLANVLRMVYDPTDDGKTTAPKNEEEWRKKLTSELMAGDSHIIIDNIDSRIKSESLAAILTQRIWKDRRLGKNDEILRLPNTAVWVATGNNPEFDSDIVRRTLYIRLIPKHEKPSERPPDDFKHHPLEAWTKQNRGRLVTATITLVNNWIKEGRPDGKYIMGTFDHYASVMSGILEACGLKGLGENTDKFKSRRDIEHNAWVELVNVWWNEYGSDPVSAGELFHFASFYDAGDAPMGSTFNGEGLDLLSYATGMKGGNDHSRRVRIGFQLQSMENRIFAGKEIVDAGTKDGKQTYRLEKRFDTRADTSSNSEAASTKDESDYDDIPF